MMKSNARRKTRSQLFGEVGLTSSGEFGGIGLQFFQPFRVFNDQALANTLGQVFGFGLGTSARPHKHQHLSTLVQAIADHAPNGMTLETNQVSGCTECGNFPVLAGRLDLPWFNMEIVEGCVFQGDRTPVRLNQIGVKPLRELR